jgi:ribosomal peptide maturation radical SAM protein 1
MPWATPHAPSIQIGTLEAVLRRHDVPVRSFSMFLHYADFLRERARRENIPFFLKKYYDVMDSSFTGIAEWIFTCPPYHTPSREKLDNFIRTLSLSQPDVPFILFAREQTPAFLEYATRTILKESPQIVGFTSTFSQHVPSLALAKALKAADPGILIVFGGANCEGPMGERLIESFSYVDYVVRGEGEYNFPSLIDAISAGGALSSIPGLCYRSQDGFHVNECFSSVQVQPEDIPEPLYDEYFDLLGRSPSRTEIEQNVRLPVESSRGCWWGEKHHCTFCGLNGLTMTFRSKDSKKFIDELLSLSRRFSTTRFQATDNIVDMRYFKTVLPELAEAKEDGYDFSLFYETKANLKKAHVAALAAAGVDEIQPGIESLSNRILKLIDKGVTALQNIQLLKWAKEYGIKVAWNLIHGFPGESDLDWNETLELIPLLNHLEPPLLIPLLMERFSPYFDRPDQYGIKDLQPMWWYKYLYPVDETKLNDIAYYFSHTCDRTASPEAIDRVRSRLDELWKRDSPETKTSSLTYLRGPGFVRVSDRRLGRPRQETVLRGLSAEVFLHCDAISSVRQIAESLEQDPDAVAKVCDRLVDLRIVLRDGEKYLALPTSPRPMVSVQTRESAFVPATA